MPEVKNTLVEVYFWASSCHQRFQIFLNLLDGGVKSLLTRLKPLKPEPNALFARKKCKSTSDCSVS